MQYNKSIFQITWNNTANLGTRKIPMEIVIQIHASKSIYYSLF